MIAVVRDLVFRDFWLKLFSLVLAVLIWLTIWLFAIRNDMPPSTALGNARLEERTFYNIPVLVMSAAADVRDFKVSPGEVAIRVRGEIKELHALEQKLHDDPQAREIRALVDLTGIEPVQGMRKKIVVTTPADITFEEALQALPNEVEIIEPTKH
jgi:hypothetical protein